LLLCIKDLNATYMSSDFTWGLKGWMILNIHIENQSVTVQ
jgi:hypothetical protein